MGRASRGEDRGTGPEGSRRHRVTRLEPALGQHGIDPPGNGGSGIDVGHGPGCHAIEDRDQQWIMGAGQDHRIGAPAVAVDEGQSDLVPDVFVIDGSAS